MPKKIKLNLKDLNVKSFQTSQENGVKGGAYGVQCSEYIFCQNTNACWSDHICETKGRVICRN
jgi:hypothetical protein